jgi:cellulose synthase/poly-beta-1,6-N-acetylglucosamine synthase-like glycosyltransferase
MISSLLAASVSLAIIVLAIPVLVIVVQILAACVPSPRPARAIGPRPAVAVLVPAHNEAGGIATTLRALWPQLNTGDRLLVVADNCSDETAAQARAAGAEVIERQHLSLRGKGYALAFGVEHLRSSPPAVLVIVDADCEFAAGALDALVAHCVQAGAPAQARNLMVHQAPARLNGRVAEFAWRVKNWVRPRGYARLGLPCPLTGTGMAFPWPLIKSAQLASGSLVEDMQLGIDMVVAGHAPVFCEEALVTSAFPETLSASASQRTRWEHGHLGMILQRAPGLILAAGRRRDLRLLAVALDLAVPPLALLMLLTILGWSVAGAAAWAGLGLLAWYAASGCLSVLALAVGLAWAGWGRAVLSLADLASVPWYVAGKLGIYLRFWSRRQKDWVRTDRE